VSVEWKRRIDDDIRTKALEVTEALKRLRLRTALRAWRELYALHLERERQRERLRQAIRDLLTDVKNAEAKAQAEAEAKRVRWWN